MGVTLVVALVLAGKLSPPPPPPAAEPAALNPADAPWVHVTLRAADSDVWLGRIPTRSGDVSLARDAFLGERPLWECAAPCGKLSPRGDDTFLVGGTDITDSALFNLTGDARVVLDVRSGSSTLKPVGILSLISGALGLAVGVLWAVFAGNDSMRAAGLSIGAGGVALVTGGIVSIYLSKTRVKISVAPAGAK